ncbi:MAG: queuine tRNA-ribosyltransferase family protein [Candidatus Coatesbacteria bacterium]|nr:queuine tRNA-ribosyltransferase family protein [Candidatus Coatesbacteria bacterium]
MGLKTRSGELPYPGFLPDATRGVVKSVSAEDLVEVGISGIMVNSIHLAGQPGVNAISRLGGIHKFMGWSGPVMSDSGGFQVYSLIAEQSKLGSVSDKGFSYRFSMDEEKRLVTPEKSIIHQFRLGTDVMFCLDECTHPDDSEERQVKSCERTIAWARRCKAEFENRIANLNGDAQPLLFAVVQGGSSTELRRLCVEQLLEIGFDGYGFGGWPVGADGALVDTVYQVAEMLPQELPKHALGIGKPENLVRAYRAGYHLFDCALPTRDARRKRLFVFNETPDMTGFKGSEFYHYIYLQDAKHAVASGPVDETCDCSCCKNYSRAYLHHLFKIGDALAERLATIHNLRFYVRILNALKEGVADDE